MHKHILKIIIVDDRAMVCIDTTCFPITTSGLYNRKDILNTLDNALDTQAISLADISSIEVDQDNRSFTQSRITIAVANALAHAHGIPIRYSGQKNQKVLMPLYSGEPHITRKK